MGKNMINDIFDGNWLKIGEINAFAGMGHYNAMGNVALSGVTPGEGMNLPNQFSAVHNASRSNSGGQQH